MKYITTIIVSLMLIPSVSFAAPLTTDQATSLIAVVQSSPETPASAFVSLITNFSNITVPQAESLITVVQSALGAPASAFINLLLSFTVDPVVTQSPPAVVPVQPESPPIVGSTPTSPQGQTQTPVVVLPVMKELKVYMLEGPALYDIVAYYTEDGKDIEGVPVTITVPDGYVFGNDNVRGTEVTVKTHRAGGAGENRFGAVFHYRVETEGIKTVTVTANGITSTATK